MNKIESFHGEYRFLSNFWPCRIEFEGQVFPTTEHAYQAGKTFSKKEREQFTTVVAPVLTAGQAKKAGAKVTLRPDWRHINIDLMRELNFQKFSTNPELKEKLLATGDAVLEEGNTWGDTFWGICNGAGENWLGKVLMEVREELRGEENVRQQN